LKYPVGVPVDDLSLDMEDLSLKNDNEILNIGDMIEGRLGPQKEKLRIYDLLNAMFIGKIINISSSSVVNRARQITNINIYSNATRKHFNRRWITTRQTTGLKLMRIVKKYGWAVLLGENVFTYTLRDKVKGDCSDLNVEPHYQKHIDLVISSKEAKDIIIKLVGMVTSNIGYVKQLVQRIEDGLKLL
jgi:hypothetical protein